MSKDTNYVYLQKLKEAILSAAPDAFKNEENRDYFFKNIHVILKLAEIYANDGYEAALKFMKSVDDHDMLHFLYIMAILMPRNYDEAIYNIYRANHFNASEAYMFLQYYYGISLISREKSITTILAAMKSIMPAEYWDELSDYLGEYDNIDIFKWNKDIDPFEVFPRNVDDDISTLEYISTEPGKRLEAYADGKDNLSAKNTTLDLMKKFESISDTASSHNPADNHYVDYLMRGWKEQDAVIEEAVDRLVKKEEKHASDSIIQQIKAEAAARENKDSEAEETVTPEEAGDMLAEKDETYPEPAPDAFRAYIDVGKQSEKVVPIEDDEIDEPEDASEPIIEPMPPPVPQPLPAAKSEEPKPYAEAAEAKNEFMAFINSIKPA